MKITSTGAVIIAEMSQQDLMFMVCDTLSVMVGKEVASLTVLSLIAAKETNDTTVVNEFINKFKDNPKLSPYRREVLTTGIQLILSNENMQPVEPRIVIQN